MSSSLPMGTYKTESMTAGWLSTIIGHGTRKYKNDDIIIAFIGRTGTGKSQVIDTLTGQQGRRAKESLRSVTKDLEASRILDHETYGSRIVVVDTPGFDDSSRSDEQILNLIGKWLKNTYKKEILLSGIVYVHPITDERMSGSPQKNLSVFKELTGPGSAKNVLLATTMWDKLIDSDDGDYRENRLKVDYWKGMIEEGAAVERFLNTSTSAWSIVDNIVNRHKQQKATLLFQEERVDQQKRFEETSARKAIYRNPGPSVDRKNRDAATVQQSA